VFGRLCFLGAALFIRCAPEQLGALGDCQAEPKGAEWGRAEPSGASNVHPIGSPLCIPSLSHALSLNWTNRSAGAEWNGAPTLSSH